VSTILKALRRLEEEQLLEQSHSLRERVVGGPGDQSRTSARLKIALLLTGGFASAAVGGLAFTVWTSQGTQGLPAVATAVTHQPALSAPLGNPTPAPGAPLAAAREAVAQGAPPSVARAVDVAAHPPPGVTRFIRAVAAPSVGKRQDDERPGLRQPTVDPEASLDADWVAGFGRWTDSLEGEASAAPTGPTPWDPGFGDEVGSASSNGLRLDSVAAIDEPTLVARRNSDSGSAPAESSESAGGVEFAEDVALVTREESPVVRIGDLNRKRAEPESSPSRQAEHSLRVVRRAKVPSVEVVQTIWHPRPERRQAVLRVANQDALVRLSEGDTVGPLVVLEIQPAGVVFDHEGLQIQRRVGAGP